MTYGERGSMTSLNSPDRDSIQINDVCFPMRNSASMSDIRTRRDSSNSFKTAYTSHGVFSNALKQLWIIEICT